MPDTATTDAEELPPLPRGTLRQMNRTFIYQYRSYANKTTARNGFVRFLARNVASEREAYGVNYLSRYRVPRPNEIAACSRCAYYEYNDRLTNAAGRQRICGDCIQWYMTCNGCGQLEYSSSFYATGTTTYSVCIRCINARYFHCTDCNTYYPNSRRRQHRHLDNQCCDSPKKTFQVPNNGDGMLANDTRVRIELAAGEISEEGIAQIATHIRNQAYYLEDYDTQCNWTRVRQRLADVLGNKWQTKDGNYAKRLSRFAYKEYGLKTPPELMTLVGNAARDHSAGVEHYIEVTRELNLPAAEFAHAGSCWWQSYSSSRCTFKTNGGFAIRTFNESGGRVLGRAWVVPLKLDRRENLVATFNTETPDAYMVFNGYGNLNGYIPARILSHMTGKTYKKMGFSCGRMYINAGGYMVASEEIIERYRDSSISLDVAVHSNLFESENRELANA